MHDTLHVLVLCGGPDREREVSLMSGANVARALREAGHRVTEGDLQPGDTAALDAFAAAHGDVVFPVFHGKWGEGGGAQVLLETSGLPFVGCGSAASRLCMDKAATKRALEEAGLPTPEYELLDPATQVPSLDPPVVLKPNDDGSSIDLALCRDGVTLSATWAELSARNPRLLVERLIEGKEVTVGFLGETALSAIWVRPATAFYDYEAKYERDDTQYRFDLDEPPEVLDELRRIAVEAARVLGLRHLGRVDLFIDAEHRPWVIEVNTMPGFTDHSLLPMAARHAGMDTPVLVDRLVRMAVAD